MLQFSLFAFFSSHRLSFVLSFILSVGGVTSCLNYDSNLLLKIEPSPYTFPPPQPASRILSAATFDNHRTRGKSASRRGFGYTRPSLAAGGRAARRACPRGGAEQRSRPGHGTSGTAICRWTKAAATTQRSVCANLGD